VRFRRRRDPVAPSFSPGRGSIDFLERELVVVAPELAVQLRALRRRQRQEGPNRHQRIVDLVREAGGERAQRAQPVARRICSRDRRRSSTRKRSRSRSPPARRSRRSACNRRRRSRGRRCGCPPPAYPSRPRARPTARTSIRRQRSRWPMRRSGASSVRSSLMRTNWTRPSRSFPMNSGAACEGTSYSAGCRAIEASRVALRTNCRRSRSRRRGTHSRRS